MVRRIVWLMIVSLVIVVSACGDSGVAIRETTAAPPEATSTMVPSTTSSTMVVSTTTAVADEPVVWPTDGWPEATPESQGMDSEALAVLVERLTSVGGIDSLTVIRNGYVVVDAVFHPFPADGAHNVYSVTKSFIGTLIGIAIDRGLLAGVDTRVVEILADAAPDEVGDRRSAITVEDLLRMTPGFACRDDSAFNYQGLEALVESDDWTAHVLSLPMVEEPGAFFEYCNQASFLLSAILSEVTGMPASEFAREVLFEPLGIGDHEWPASPDGISLGFSDLVLQPKDMAKLGYLYLHEGRWQGEQIVSPDWVETATQEQIDPRLAGYAYGYQWWVYPPAEYAMALGRGGQYVVVDPAHELLVVTTAGEASLRPEGLTNEVVRNAVRGYGSLAPDPEAEARLAAAVARAEAGPDAKEFELPRLAVTVSGVRYSFRPNDLGFDSFVLEFGDEGAVLEVADTVAQARYEVGLDGRFAVTNGTAPMAMRGRWLGDSTFIIAYQTVGMADRGTLQLRFVDDRAHVLLSTPDTSESMLADRAG